MTAIFDGVWTSDDVASQRGLWRSNLPSLVGAVIDDVPEDHGEQLHVFERVVISPCAGVFEPAGAAVMTVGAGARIEVGTVVGQVSTVLNDRRRTSPRREVRSPFAGLLMAMLALPGERVRPGQPVAWLRLE